MKSLKLRRSLQCQRGATLIVALIMLVLLTLFALTAMNASNTSLKIASNTQTRNEVISAVQQEVDKVTSVNFTINPAFWAGNKSVDINSDGAPDYDVIITTPVCMSVVPIKNNELKPVASPEDAKCFIGGGAIDSLCSNTRWDVGASATDPISGATATIHQGIGVRVSVGAPCT